MEREQIKTVSVDRLTSVSYKMSRNAWLAFAAYFFYSLWIHFNFNSIDSMALHEPASNAFAYVTSVYVNGGALLLFALFHKKLEPLVFSQTMVIVAVAGCVLGTLLSSATDLLTLPRGSVEIISGVLTGIGSTPLQMMLAVLLVRNGNFVLSVLFGFLLSNLATLPLRILPPPLLLALVILMPIASLACLMFARTEGAKDDLPVLTSEDRRLLIPLVIRAACAVLIIYIGISLANMVAQADGIQPDPFAMTLATVVIGGVFALSIHGEGGKVNILSVYRTVFFCVLLGLLMIPLVPDHFDFSYGIIVTMNTVVRAFIFVVEYLICRKTGLSPLVVFGVGETVKKIPGLVNRGILGLEPLQHLVLDPQVYGRMCIVLGLVVVVAYVLLFTENHLATLTKDHLTVSQEQQLEAQCDALAREFRLTEREREILGFLTAGRNAPWIAKELYVSQATVNVHIKNIYRKCSVHSRQELLDLVR